MYQAALASQATTAAMRTARKLIPANDMAFLQPVMATSLAGKEPLREAGWAQILRAGDCRSKNRRTMSLQDHVLGEKSRTAAPRDRPPLSASTMRLVQRPRAAHVRTPALEC